MTKLALLSLVPMFATMGCGLPVTYIEPKDPVYVEGNCEKAKISALTQWNKDGSKLVVDILNRYGYNQSKDPSTISWFNMDWWFNSDDDTSNDEQLRTAVLSTFMNMHIMFDGEPLKFICHPDEYLAGRFEPKDIPCNDGKTFAFPLQGEWDAIYFCDEFFDSRRLANDHLNQIAAMIHERSHFPAVGRTTDSGGYSTEQCHDLAVNHPFSALSNAGNYGLFAFDEQN